MARTTKLNSCGAAHIIIPLLFIVGIALVGTYMLVKSHADSITSTAVLPPPNHIKATAAGTNLVRYPKLTALPSLDAPVVKTTTSPSEVVSKVDNGNGTETITTYDGAAGISPTQLYNDLKSHGVKGLQEEVVSNPKSAIIASSATLKPRIITADAAYDYCTHGNATAECSGGYPIHWQNNGFAHPQIYFVDTSGSKWKVDTATYTWNRAQGIDSHYVWKSCPTTRGIHCVSIQEGRYTSAQMGGSNVAGQTIVVNNSSTRNIVSASIKLNDTTSDYNNVYGHAQEICHEEGHALGLGHNFSKSSCLYSAVLNSASSQNPSNDDFGFLASIYQIAH